MAVAENIPPRKKGKILTANFPCGAGALAIKQHLTHTI